MSFLTRWVARYFKAICLVNQYPLPSLKSYWHNYLGRAVMLLSLLYLALYYLIISSLRRALASATPPALITLLYPMDSTNVFAWPERLPLRQ